MDDKSKLTYMVIGVVALVLVAGVIVWRSLSATGYDAAGDRAAIAAASRAPSAAAMQSVMPPTVQAPQAGLPLPGGKGGR